MNLLLLASDSFSSSEILPLFRGGARSFYHSNIMKKRLIESLAILALGALSTANLFPQDVEPGFKSLFNGKDLTNWAGRTNHWSVEDSVITGITTKENPAKGNNFLILQQDGTNAVYDDFEIRFSYKFSSDWGNSGLQYRSKARPNFVVGGYQGDFEVGIAFSGILYEELGRGILAERGQKIIIRDDDGKLKKEIVGKVNDSQAIQDNIKKNDWNDYVIIAKGNHLQHFINGMQTVDVVDEQESKAAKSGIIAFQIHAGPPMKVQFRNIRIKELK